MADDLDALDDIFADKATKNARPAGKFQPKPKFRPQRKDSAKTSVALQTVQTIDSAPKELCEPIASANPLGQSSNAVPEDITDMHTVTEPPVGEVAGISIGLDALGDVLPQSLSDKEYSVPPSAAVTSCVPNSKNIGRSESQVLFSSEDSTHTSMVADVPENSGPSTKVKTETFSEPIVSNANIYNDARDKELGTEEMDFVHSINMPELTDKHVQKPGELKPKQNVQQSILLDTESVSEINCAETDSVPISHQDDILDLSSIEFTNTLPTESSELPVNEGSMNLMDMTELNSCTHLDNSPKIPAKLISRRAKTGSRKSRVASDPSSQQQNASPSSQDIESGRSLRPRKCKTTICELRDEDGCGVIDTEEVPQECSPIMEENNNDNNQVTSEQPKKKLKRKSKKTDDGKEKPAKNSKIGKKASDQEGAKRKKFSHSTRRRQVNKALLETPEDEIDHQNVPLRDLILLAEHREREMKRELAAGGAPATTQSSKSSGLHNGGDFTFEEGEDYNDEEYPQENDNTEYYNYHSHMDKTRTKRWSKVETELFYEAVRMFGTDLSMITLRLPGRSRHEVKLKYKKEERQQPLLLNEALTNRSKDRTQFEMVVEHLRKKTAEENENADKEDSEKGGLDEGTSIADDDEVKGEHGEDEENDNVANDYTDDEIPLKSDEVEEEEGGGDGEGDEDIIWSQYKSGI